MSAVSLSPSSSVWSIAWRTPLPKAASADGAKKAAAWYIDTGEKLATQALEFQAKAGEWAKETPFYSLIEAQQSFGRKLVEQSASTARTLWRLQ